MGIIDFRHDIISSGAKKLSNCIKNENRAVNASRERSIRGFHSSYIFIRK